MSVQTDLYKAIQKQIVELSEIKRTHCCATNSRITQLSKLLRWLQASDEQLGTRERWRRARARTWLVTRFNRFCPVCGVHKPESSWVVRSGDIAKTAVVCCVSCHRKGHRYTVALEGLA